MDTSFLKSTRFWFLIAVAIVRVLETQGVLGTGIADALQVVLLGSVVVRTVDRGAEKLGG